MRRQAWYQWGVLLTAGIVFFTNLGGPHLFDEDEPKNAECAREMLVRNDWVVPTFNEQLRIEKPILLYWVMLCSYKLFGVNEFGARFGSALLAFGTVWMTFQLGRLLFSPRVGLLSGIILCSCLMYAAIARASTPDATLIFFTTGSLLAFVWGVAARHGGTFPLGIAGDAAAEQSRPAVGSWKEYLPARHWLLLSYLAMGMAVLAKGPVGVVLPVGILGLFLLFIRDGEQRDDSATAAERPWWKRLPAWAIRFLSPRRLWDAGWNLNPILAIAVVAAVALPWYIAVGIQTDGEWLRGFLGVHNVGRFLKPMEGHNGSILYYIIAVFLGCFPWSMFLPVAIVYLAKQLRVPGGQRTSYLFLACWAGGFIGFFSLASTKLPNYVLPAYPALAVIIAALLDHWRSSVQASDLRWFRIGLSCVGAAGMIFAIAMPITLHLLAPGEEYLGAAGLIPLAGAAVGFWYLKLHRPQPALISLTVCAVTFAVTLLGGVSTQLSVHQESPFFAQAATNETPNEQPQLATYGYFAPNLVFYSQRQVLQFGRPEQVQDFLAKKDSNFVILPADQLEQLREQITTPVTLVAQKNRFMRDEELVMLKVAPSFAATETAVARQ